MKKFSVFPVVLGCTLPAGCIADSGKSDDGDTGGNAAVNAYLPLPMNNVTTVWRVKKPFPVDQSFDETINRPLEWGGNDIYTLTRSSITNGPARCMRGETPCSSRSRRACSGGW